MGAVESIAAGVQECINEVSAQIPRIQSIEQNIQLALPFVTHDPQLTSELEELLVAFEALLANLHFAAEDLQANVQALQAGFRGHIMSRVYALSCENSRKHVQWADELKSDWESLLDKHPELNRLPETL